jgi:hypothetical protein
MVSEIPKKIYKAVIGLIALCLSLTSVFGTLSAVTIFSNSGNIQAGTISESPADNFNVPILINNTGFYDIENVTISIQLVLYNATFTPHVLMEKSIGLGTFPAQVITTKNANFSVTADFDLPSETIIPGMMKINATFTIDLYYMFSLMHFTAEYTQTELSGVDLLP